MKYFVYISIMKCCICKGDIEKERDPITNKVYWEEGNNAQPYKDGRCCNICNFQLVIPYRIVMGRIDVIKKECFNN
jgi:hypothetical protein